MAIPYIITSTPKTKPISASGLNANFDYLEKSNLGGMDVPKPPSDQTVYILASQGGFLFWMPTEEC